MFDKWQIRVERDFTGCFFHDDVWYLVFVDGCTVRTFKDDYAIAVL